jgi:hypothetical protein
VWEKIDMATTEWAAPAATPGLVHLFTMRAALVPGLDSGEGPLGRRTLNLVAKGDFRGERLRGEIDPGSGDWMLTRNNIRVVDARVVLHTDDGALIHMSYGGRVTFSEDFGDAARDPSKRHLIDPSKYYFRTTPLFETGAARYAWINGIVAIGSGRLIEGGGVAYDVFELQ